jgi:hypothetical protein
MWRNTSITRPAESSESRTAGGAAASFRQNTSATRCSFDEK